MTRWGANIFGLAAGGALVLASGCASPEFEGCGTARTCESAGGSAGTGGVSGSGGGGGTGDVAGSSGTVGGGGLVAQGGAAGSELGGGGQAGDAGSGDGGEAGGAAGGDAPCDATATPGEDACVIDEEYGVFASPDGDDDTGRGTRARPYATLGKAIEEATADNRRVYACADGGEFEESVALGVEASGLELFGGFSCDDWSYVTGARTLVRSEEPMALHADNVFGLRIEDFGFEAGDATVPGGSSIAVFAANSIGVVLRRVKLQAGKGLEGVNGVREDFGFPLAPDLDGYDASGIAGGRARFCVCPDDSSSSGGEGGDVRTETNAGAGMPDWGGGESLPAGSCDAEAQRGANGPTRTSAPGALVTGVLSDEGWMPARGGDGEPGFPGQGGAGGPINAGDIGSNIGGGGGGCGSCGGAGGPGGQGGGASVALALFESEAAVEDSELSADDAGDGGSGAAGQAGQMLAGTGGKSGGACDGGAGGLGGKGAAGGGGAGGFSVGVLWSGETEPALDGNEFSLGSAGVGGIGGEPGVNDGIVGEALEVLEAP